MNDTLHMHAVIMAGGSGTRFWPLSRKNLPKQFLALTSEKSLLRETYLRLREVVSADRIWVIANAHHVDLARSELPEVPPENIIGEPVGRNTAPCIGLAAACVAAKDPQARLLVCPADHSIRPVPEFASSVATALAALDQLETEDEPFTVTFGIKPHYPATGFGYIERGEGIRVAGEDAGVFSVSKFKEKPSSDVAREYIDSGSFYWNSGIFLWRAGGILQLIETHLPELSAGIDLLSQSGLEPADLQTTLDEHFARLPSISIDYGVLEKTPSVAVVEATFEWDDVGSWKAVERYATDDGAGNHVIGRHVGIDTGRSIVVAGKRLVATIGLSDVVVVETDDAVLVCHRDHTERVREVVDLLPECGEEQLQ